MKYIAHINNEGESQSCKEHCVNVAEYAKNSLDNVNLGNTAYLAGLLHDAGKCSEEFQEYIKKSCNGEYVEKGSIIHSFAGMSYILNNFHEGDYSTKLTSEIVAYAIGAHHGLFDCVKDSENSIQHSFDYRLNKQPEYDNKSINEFFDKEYNENLIKSIFSQSNDEVISACSKIAEEAKNELNLYRTDKPNDVFMSIFQFMIGLLCRLVLSSVIDADRVDTYKFMSKIITDDTGKLNKSVTSPKWDRYLNNLHDYLKGLPVTNEVGKARIELSDICYEFADKCPGVYEISLPTGAGKTLSSLRYALKHAIKYKKKRIIYVAPLITIIEQNAQVIKDAIGDDSAVLEHHSNIVDETDSDELNNRQLLAENWDAPIVVTTLVQFLNTLFGDKTSQVRRFSALVDSVIVIDEVQTVPWKTLSLFNVAINFLKTVCNATVLLCSATQPDLSKVDYKLIPSKERLLSPEQEDYYFNLFKRSEIIKACREDDPSSFSYSLDEIPDFIEKIIEDKNSLLVVCNIKSQAKELYYKLKNKGYNLYHLSASMCVKHRQETLKQLNQDLKSTKKVICISTQVIEAGVDISFEAVIRFAAGLDSVIQSNGRCNRSGEFDTNCQTYIIKCSDEKLYNLKEIEAAKNATVNLLAENKFQDYLSKDCIKEYYKNLFDEFDKNNTCYTIENGKNIFELLSVNIYGMEKLKCNNDSAKYIINQDFKDAGKHFKAIDLHTVSVIVPYKEGKDIISELCSDRAKYNTSYANKLIKQAKIYSISIVGNQASNLLEKNAIHKICDNTVYALNEQFYDDEVGFDIKKGELSCNILIL